MLNCAVVPLRVCDACRRAQVAAHKERLASHRAEQEELQQVLKKQTISPLEVQTMSKQHLAAWCRSKLIPLLLRRPPEGYV